jgi:aryl-alcohol dehydrogenase-like predicted oxidoreductase
MRIAGEQRSAPFVVFQGLWNLISRDAEAELVPACRAYGLSFFSWSPLAGGWLTGKYRPGQPRPPEARLAGGVDYLSVDEEDAFTAVDLLEEIGARHGATVAQTALAWQFAHPWLTSAIVGAKNTAQLDENLAAVRIELEPDEVERLDSAFASAPRWPRWQLKRTEPSRRGDPP